MASDSNSDEGSRRSWVVSHRWKLGIVAMACAGFWWRRRRQNALVLSPVSEAWLMQHEFESGREQKE